MGCDDLTFCSLSERRSALLRFPPGNADERVLLLGPRSSLRSRAPFVWGFPDLRRGNGKLGEVVKRDVLANWAGELVQDAEDFGFVGEALFDFFEGVDFHWLESGVDCCFVEGDAVGALGGELTKFIGHEHEFVDSESSFVSGAKAGFAGLVFVDSCAVAGGA